MLIVEGAEQCRDVGLIRTVANSDPQSPGVRAPDSSRHHSCMIGARDDVSRLLKKESPRVGQLDATIRPPEEARLHLVLELPNLMAQGWLRDPELGGGLSEVQ